MPRKRHVSRNDYLDGYPVELKGHASQEACE